MKPRKAKADEFRQLDLELPELLLASEQAYNRPGGVLRRGKTHPDTYNHGISQALGAYQQCLSTLDEFEDCNVTRHSL